MRNYIPGMICALIVGYAVKLAVAGGYSTVAEERTVDRYASQMRTAVENCVTPHSTPLEMSECYGRQGLPEPTEKARRLTAEEVAVINKMFQRAFSKPVQMDANTWMKAPHVGDVMTYTYIIHGVEPESGLPAVDILRELTTAEWRGLIWPDIISNICSPQGQKQLNGMDAVYDMVYKYQSERGEVLHVVTLPAGTCNDLT